MGSVGTQKTKKEQEELLCSRKDIAVAWGSSPNNIGKTYVNNPEKSSQLQVLDMGTFCMLNNITPDMLKMYVRHGKEHTAMILGQDEVENKNNKVVVMTPEQYNEYQKYISFVKFQESKK